MYFAKTPTLLQNLFPQFLWKVSTTEKILYLTFDDGPAPDVTPQVLNLLKDYDAKATFFCVGDNVKKNPHIFEEIIRQGHSVGNHTYNHLNGWETENLPYFHNVRHCAALVKSPLFRPPYGRLTPKQGQFLTRHYKIVMWDVLSGDFDQKLAKEDCLNNVVRSAKNGSIVVFHDSLKSKERMLYALPLTLEYFSDKGYRFERLSSDPDIKQHLSLETSADLGN